MSCNTDREREIELRDGLDHMSWQLKSQFWTQQYASTPNNFTAKVTISMYMHTNTLLINTHTHTHTKHPPRGTPTQTHTIMHMHARMHTHTQAHTHTHTHTGTYTHRGTHTHPEAHPPRHTQSCTCTRACTHTHTGTHTHTHTHRHIHTQRHTHTHTQVPTQTHTHTHTHIHTQIPDGRSDHLQQDIFPYLLLHQLVEARAVVFVAGAVPGHGLRRPLDVHLRDDVDVGVVQHFLAVWLRLHVTCMAGRGNAQLIHSQNCSHHLLIKSFSLSDDLKRMIPEIWILVTSIDMYILYIYIFR